MKISVLIPFRPNHQDPYRQRNFKFVQNWWREYIGRDDEIVIGNSEHEVFNRSAARNDAFRKSTGDLIIVADADTIFLDPSAVSVALFAALNGHPWVVPYEIYWNATEAYTAALLSTPFPYQSSVANSISEPGNYEHRLTGTLCGIYAVTREVFEKTGGYDERFQGWGYEDDAFGYALDMLVGKPQRVADAEVVHLWHPRIDMDFEQPYIAHNLMLLREYQAADSPDKMRQLIEERA